MVINKIPIVNIENIKPIWQHLEEKIVFAQPKKSY